MTSRRLDTLLSEDVCRQTHPDSSNTRYTAEAGFIQVSCLEHVLFLLGCYQVASQCSEGDR